MGTLLDEKDADKGQKMTEKTEAPETGSKGMYLTPEKPLDLGSVDSDLFSAILAGEVEFVRSRFRGNDRMSDAEAVLMIRTRRAEEEKAYTKEIAASQFEQAQEDPAKKIGAAFFGGMTYDAYMRNMSRPDKGDNRAGVPEADLFGGFIVPNGYRDAFGGTYDSYGYTFANGNYKTIAGDLFDMAKGTITLASGGTVIPLMAGLEKEGASVLKMGVQVADAFDNVFAQIEKEMTDTPSLAGSLLNKSVDIPGGDNIRPSANALEVGAPVATAAMATTAGISAMAMETAAPVAAAAVAHAMGNAFEMDEASRAAASFEEGGALSRMGRKRGLRPVEAQLAQKFVFQNLKDGVPHDEACKLRHHQHKELEKMVRDEVKKHNGGQVMEHLTSPEKAIMASTSLTAAKQAIYGGTAESLQDIIGKIVGAPEAGSTVLNLGKKPAFKL